MNSIVNVRMDHVMLSRTEAVAKELGYLSVQEYVREVVRQDIERHLRLKAELDVIIASARKVTPRHLTISERNRLAEQSPRRKLTAIEKELLKRQAKEVSSDARLIWGSAKGKKVKTFSQKERDGLVRELTAKK